MTDWNFVLFPGVNNSLIKFVATWLETIKMVGTKGAHSVAIRRVCTCVPILPEELENESDYNLIEPTLNTHLSVGGFLNDLK